MFKFLFKKLTKHHNEIPLFIVTFNLNKYQKYGAENSCDLKIHPDLGNDEYIKKTLNDLVDYVRKIKI
jgi:uncharacterized protein YxeA